MRLSSALKLLAVLAAALAVGLVAAAKSMDFPRMKTVLADQVRAATGRPLTIAGPLELRLGVVPRIIATGVTLGNAPGAAHAEMVKIDRVEAEVALLPLLKREVRVLRLVVNAPEITLETGRDGQPNWLFTTQPAPAATAAAPGKSGLPATRFALREVKVKNARINWRDADGGMRTFYLHKLGILPEANATDRLAVQMVGNIDTRMLDLGGRVVMPAAAGKPWTVRLQGAFDGLQAKAEGSVADPLLLGGLDLSVVMQGDELGKVVRLAGVAGKDAPPALGPFKASAHLVGGRDGLAARELEVSAGRRDGLLVAGRGEVKNLFGLAGVELALAVESDTLAGLSRLTGGDVPSIGPLKLTSTLTGSLGRWKLADIKASLGTSDMAGDLVVDVAARPRVTGALTSTQLVLADFTTPASKPGEKLAPKGLKAAGDGRLFAAEPLALAWLRDIDVQVSLRAAKVDVGVARLSEAGAELSLANGRLALRSLKAWAGGGTVEGEVMLDAAATPPVLAVRANGGGIDLGRVLKDGGREVLAGGTSDFRLALTGRGESWRALLASAAGEASLSVSEGRLLNGAVDWAGGDALVQLAGALNPQSRTEDTTPLACAVARFVVRDGVATADRGIAVETAKVNVVGAGVVDLAEERLDLGVLPRLRDGAGAALAVPLPGMVRVRGTLAEPALALDPAGLIRASAPAGANGDALVERLAADGTPCRTALGLPALKAPVLDKKAKPARRARR